MRHHAGALAAVRHLPHPVCLRDLVQLPEPRRRRLGLHLGYSLRPVECCLRPRLLAQCGSGVGGFARKASRPCAGACGSETRTEFLGVREWGEVRCTRTALFGNLLRRDAIWQQNGSENVRRRLRAFGVCVRKHVMNRVPKSSESSHTPRTDFQSSITPQREKGDSPEKGGVGKISSIAVRKRIVWRWHPLRVRSSRALKMIPGAVRRL